MWSEQQIKEEIKSTHYALQYIFENVSHDKCRIARHYGTLISLYKVLELYDQVEIIIKSYRKWKHENRED